MHLFANSRGDSWVPLLWSVRWDQWPTNWNCLRGGRFTMSSMRVCCDHSERLDGRPHRKVKMLKLKLKPMNHTTWRSCCVGDGQAPVAGGTRNFLCYGQGGALMMPPGYPLEISPIRESCRRWSRGTSPRKSLVWDSDAFEGESYPRGRVLLWSYLGAGSI